MAESESILQLGIEAARAGDKAEARELFRLVTREDPENTQGWLWLAGVAEDREEKRAALERALVIDPNNVLARKGLNTLNNARSASTAPLPVAPAPQAAPVQLPAVEAAAQTAPPPTAAPSAPDAQPVTAAPERTARQYDTPSTSHPVVDPATAAPAMVAAAEDDYDLQDYQQTPFTDPDGLPPGIALDEDEEIAQPRRGVGILPLAIGAVVLLIALFFLWQTFNNRRSTVAGPSTDGTTVATVPAGASGAGYPATTSPNTAGVAGSPSTAYPGTTQVPVAGNVEQTAVPAAGETAQAAQETVIVIVPPDATPAPTEAPTAPPETPTPAPPPASTGDVASANPAIVPNDTDVKAGNWTFRYSGIQNITSGPYGGVTPTHGQYQIVLLAVANTGDQPATIPDGFFVLKDAQGHVFDFVRAASVDYFNRNGGAGNAADVGADAQFPNNSELTSVPLMFDVPPDAPNLVLVSRDNLNQGIVIR